MSKKVKFYKGKKESYAQLYKTDEIIYFSTDDHIIYNKGEAYGVNPQTIDDLSTEVGKKIESFAVQVNGAHKGTIKTSGIIDLTDGDVKATVTQDLNSSIVKIKLDVSDDVSKVKKLEDLAADLNTKSFGDIVLSNTITLSNSEDSTLIKLDHGNNGMASLDVSKSGNEAIASLSLLGGTASRPSSVDFYSDHFTYNNMDGTKTIAYKDILTEQDNSKYVTNDGTNIGPIQLYTGNNQVQVRSSGLTAVLETADELTYGVFEYNLAYLKTLYPGTLNESQFTSSKLSITVRNGDEILTAKLTPYLIKLTGSSGDLIMSPYEISRNIIGSTDSVVWHEELDNITAITDAQINLALQIFGQTINGQVDGLGPNISSETLRPLPHP